MASTAVTGAAPRSTEALLLQLQQLQQELTALKERWPQLRLKKSKDGPDAPFPIELIWQLEPPPSASNYDVGPYKLLLRLLGAGGPGRERGSLLQVHLSSEAGLPRQLLTAMERQLQVAWRARQQGAASSWLLDSIPSQLQAQFVQLVTQLPHLLEAYEAVDANDKTIRRYALFDAGSRPGAAAEGLGGAASAMAAAAPGSADAAGAEGTGRTPADDAACGSAGSGRPQTAAAAPAAVGSMPGASPGQVAGVQAGAAAAPPSAAQAAAAMAPSPSQAAVARELQQLRARYGAAFKLVPRLSVPASFPAPGGNSSSIRTGSALFGGNSMPAAESALPAPPQSSEPHAAAASAEQLACFLVHLTVTDPDWTSKPYGCVLPLQCALDTRSYPAPGSVVMLVPEDDAPHLPRWLRDGLNRQLATLIAGLHDRQSQRQLQQQTATDAGPAGLPAAESPLQRKQPPRRPGVAPAGVGTRPPAARAAAAAAAAPALPMLLREVIRHVENYAGSMAQQAHAEQQAAAAALAAADVAATAAAAAAAAGPSAAAQGSRSNGAGAGDDARTSAPSSSSSWCSEGSEGDWAEEAAGSGDDDDDEERCGPSGQEEEEDEGAASGSRDEVQLAGAGESSRLAGGGGGAAAAAVRKAYSLVLQGLKLENAGVLQLIRAQVLVACNRCRAFEALNLESESLCTGRQPWQCEGSCPACHAAWSLSMAPRFVHDASNVAGLLHCFACTPYDLLPSMLAAQCGGCSAVMALRSVQVGAPASRGCSSCHQQLAVSFGAVAFIPQQQQQQPSLGHGAAGGAQRAGPVSRSKPLSHRTGSSGAAAGGSVAGHHDALSALIRGTLPVGQPLPARGTCSHYRHSYRWLRFPCCGARFPCDLCHELAVPDGHPAEWASRMICGFCSTEQALDGQCKACGKKLANSGALPSGRLTRFWEGGQGCRDPRRLDRNDPHKYRLMGKSGKTKSAKHTRVGPKAWRKAADGGGAAAE